MLTKSAYRYWIAIGCFLFLASAVQAGVKDSLLLKNGDIIVGELKSLDKGVLTVETDYSKSDFTIEWSGVKEIYTQTRFLITLRNGDRLNGSIRTQEKNVQIDYTDKKGDSLTLITLLDDIVFLRGVKSNFWSRAKASVDVGFTLTRANNLRQRNIRTNFGYVAEKWMTDFYYNDLRSQQDSTQPTKRTETGAKFNYYLPGDWFLGASVNTLSNTEQALKLRVNTKLGGGKYFVHTNRKYWAAVTGLALSMETFLNETPRRNGVEIYAGSELNLFDIGDFSLSNSVYVYPSLSQSGRWRSDIKLDTKYSFPKDIYLKLGLTLNYDNRPAIVGRETDYITTFTIGWEL